MTSVLTHQYIKRENEAIMDERLFADKIINAIYSIQRECPSVLFNVLTSKRASKVLAFFNYDLPMGDKLTGGRKLLLSLGVDMSECLDPPRKLNTVRNVFERKIKYWDCRPMTQDDAVVVSPADAKMIVGSFASESLLFIKEKFFHFEELLGADKKNWISAFKGGDFSIFRLTPEKYHYNHTPVSGKVVDIYEIDGRYHSCNPGAVVSLITPFSKNKRVVTIIDTDVSGGSHVGKVAMIEITALMIGEIVQCYSDIRYDLPIPVKEGMLLKKGQPKSLYRPGSSVDVVIFEKNKIRFSKDILRNLNRTDVNSRFSRHFQKSLVETEVKVRSPIAERIDKK
ncbi:MAG: phosphatidylserine decarboxylase [Proteobacteria bacterium]|nr:phosphatidylserine decarboxylase [Pseudomonadota bacterium]